MIMNASTKVIAIFGNPINHSLSPLIQNAWLKAHGENIVYFACDVSPQNLKSAVDGAKAMGFKGINITVPHKVNVLKYVDGIESAVKAIGSANTITIENGLLTAYNTDYLGCIADFKANKIAVKNKNVFVYGAGGAAKAVLAALNTMGAPSVFVSSIIYKEAAGLAKQFGVSCVKHGDENKTLSQCEIFINASSCGMKAGDKPHFEIAKPPKVTLVYDLIYAKNTPFKKLAKKYKIKYIDGTGFLARQAAEGFRLWTGKYPNVSTALNLLKKHAR